MIAEVIGSYNSTCTKLGFNITCLPESEYLFKVLSILNQHHIIFQHFRLNYIGNINEEMSFNSKYALSTGYTGALYNKIPKKLAFTIRIYSIIAQYLLLTHHTIKNEIASMNSL